MAFGGDTAESYYDEGLTASIRGDLDEAVRFFEKAIELDYNFTSAYHQLAKCHARRGEPERALPILNRVVAERPELVPPRIDLGFAYVAAGEHEKALHQFRQVLVIDPDNGRAHLGVAQALFRQGEFAAAAAAARMAVDEGGALFAALFLLGRAALQADQPAVAADALERADKLVEKQIELTPEQPEGYFFRGELKFVTEHYASALEQYRAAEDRASKGTRYTAFGEPFSLPDILVRQGQCYERLGKTERAREMGRRILELDPGNPHGRALASEEQ